MDHINYFEPYTSKEPNHEDQLTRAFLVVLRCVPSALMMFYDYVRKEAHSKAKKDGVPESSEEMVPPISKVGLGDIQFKTQTGDLTEAGSKLLSVYITDEEQFKVTNPISEADRTARYDGVIHFSGDITFFIENKPSSADFYADQMNPSVRSLPEGEEREVIPVPAVLEWKKIIKNLNWLTENGILCKAEKELVDDFLSFIDTHFPSLNPYDSIGACKGDIGLLNRRLVDIFEKSVAKGKENVGRHRGWKYILNLPGQTFPEIKMVGFGVGKTEKGWELKIELCFGDTLNQARALYKTTVDEKVDNLLKNGGWKYAPNFHISYISKHLVWLETGEEHRSQYLQYWNKNQEMIKQYSKVGLKELIQKLKNDGILEVTEQDESNLTSSIYSTGREEGLNVAPGFELSFSMNSKNVAELDEKGELAKEITNRIKEGLSILGEREVDFLKEDTEVKK